VHHVSSPEQVIVLRLDRRRQLLYLLLFAALVPVYGLLTAAAVLPPLIGVAGMLVFGGVAILTTVVVIRNKELGRLSVQGLTLEGGSLIPWPGISSVAIGLMRPKALFWMQPLRTVEFLPTDQGAARRALPRSRRQVASVSTRLYGTPILLMEKTLVMTAEEVVTAVQSFAHLEVEYVRGAKPK